MNISITSYVNLFEAFVLLSEAVLTDVVPVRRSGADIILVDLNLAPVDRDRTACIFKICIYTSY